MEENLNEFVSELKRLYSENLVSVILYGSAAHGDHVEEKSDVNIMIVLKDVSLDLLSSAEKIILKGQKKIKLNPFFWSEDEFRRSLDVFPIEFTDIIQNRRILYGADLLSLISIDTKNLRHQIELELRIKLLRLRSEWLRLRKDKSSMEDFLIRAGTSLHHLYLHANKIWNDKILASIEEPFVTCKRLKKKEIKMNLSELEKLYLKMHASVKELTKILDTME